MVLEIKYVDANNAVIHTENLVTGILAKLAWDLGFGPNLVWELGFGPNLVWELGFGTPRLHDPHVTLTVLCSFQEPLSFSLFLLQTRKLAGPRLASLNLLQRSFRQKKKIPNCISYFIAV